MADRRHRPVIFLFLLVCLAFPARADWLQGNVATLQGLDKITARISRLDVDVASPTRFGALMITIHACTFKSPDEPPEHAALMAINSVDHDGVVSAEPLFQGWMFASSPAISALEHPVYDISVLSCRKE
ncbi:MAG: DUF2155 domain-containing protein [Candidatus Puniceispirillales bacterium]